MTAPGPESYERRLLDLHRRIRRGVREAMRTSSEEALAAPHESGDGDTIFGIDIAAEDILVDFFSAWGQEEPVLAIAEGFPAGGARMFPDGASIAEAAHTCIVDPIDGTRGLLYGKRSAWILAAIAPPPNNDGRLPTLADIEFAAMTELPTLRSDLSDVLWAERGGQLHAETHDLRSGDAHPFTPRPSRADSLLYGFGSVTKFFPGGKVVAADIEERLAAALLGEASDPNPRLFDDEYICSGGQLYELMCGHDRFIADLRPLIQAHLGLPQLCAHPYDLCTQMLAGLAGVQVTDETGSPLRSTLDIRANVAWIGYASSTLRVRIEPVLQGILRDVGLA